VFDQIDRVYYERRAREARERASASIDPAVAQIHLAVAEDYQRKAEALAARCSNEADMQIRGVEAAA